MTTALMIARILVTLAVLAIAIHIAGGDTGIRHDTKEG